MLPCSGCKGEEVLKDLIHPTDGPPQDVPEQDALLAFREIFARSSLMVHLSEAAAHELGGPRCLEELLAWACSGVVVFFATQNLAESLL